MAEQSIVSIWRQFKESFLHSLLSEDYDSVVARKLQERKQGTIESITPDSHRVQCVCCPYAGHIYFVSSTHWMCFNYYALCLRWKKGMSEKGLVQAILRSCNTKNT